MNIWFYDIETLSNCFTYTAINREDKKAVQYVIWNDRNDLLLLLDHLSLCKGLIGFNNLAFDYPVIHYILTNGEKFKKYTADKIAKLIYKKAQETIQKEFSTVKKEDIIIPQLDLFKIWHYDNRAKMTSLKKLEIVMRFPNVQEMPFSHEREILNNDEVLSILEYNLNDVEATAEFYEKTIPKIDLRKGILSKYGLDCLNYSDSKIGEELTLKLYCEATGQEIDKVKKGRTRRYKLKFEECVPSYVKFYTPEFNGLLEYINSIEVSELKDSFKYGFEYKNFTFDLGTGGIHGCIKPGVYISDEKRVIVDADVASLYPSLAIANKLYPEHLGEVFFDVYREGIVAPRLEAKKMGDKVMDQGYKLSANSVYGKSNSEYSFLYDPLYTLKTTLAGQLSLCMLSEMLMSRIPDLTMLQINTDGLTVVIPVEQKRPYWEICKEWEAITGLSLEYVGYTQMIIRDVNNYIACSNAGKVKYKGAFKPHYEMLKDDEYHKSFSQGIVPIAISAYFLNNIPVETTIKNHKDIFDFLKVFNASHGWKCETLEIDENGIESDVKSEQKINRYYITKTGRRFRKYKEDKKIEIEASRSVIILNKFQDLPMETYDVDYEYYVDECYKIIHKIDGTEERRMEVLRQERELEKKYKEEQNYLKYCVDKIPTELQFKNYSREWLIEKYGYPAEIKPSKTKQN